MLYRITRLFRHRWMDEAHRVIGPRTLLALTQAVAAGERRHSGEIRVCIEAGLRNRDLLRPDPTPALVRQRALDQFGQLQVWDTAQNNGVLIYLLLAEQAIEVVADRGLNAHVSPTQWQALVQRLGGALQAGQWEAGLTYAIAEVSDLLAAHFPLQEGAANPNELPDKPVLG